MPAMYVNYWNKVKLPGAKVKRDGETRVSNVDIEYW